MKIPAVRLRRRCCLAAVVAVLAPARARRAPLVTPQPSPQIIEQVLVKVNGDIITKTELEERQIAALRSDAQASIPSR